MQVCDLPPPHEQGRPDCHNCNLPITSLVNCKLELSSTSGLPRTALYVLVITQNVKQLRARKAKKEKESASNH